MKTLLAVQALKKTFPIQSPLLKRTLATVHAVEQVSFNVAEGEVLGIVGESGCGKSTVAKLLMNLLTPDSGSLHFLGQNLLTLKARERRNHYTRLQMIFQDTASSLNPRMTITRIIAEPLIIHEATLSRSERETRVKQALAEVELSENFLHRYPHELSGGQKQRVAIARAIILRPKLIIADEAVSALDVSVQAQIINLMNALKKRLNIAFVFISHDLSIVKHFSDNVVIMYLGRIVEQATTRTIFSNPLHPYTQALLASVAKPKVPKKRTPHAVIGEPPSPITPPSGCHFHPRCPSASERCRTEIPVLQTHQNKAHTPHLIACHLYDS